MRVENPDRRIGMSLMEESYVVINWMCADSKPTKHYVKKKKAKTEKEDEDK